MKSAALLALAMPAFAQTLPRPAAEFDFALVGGKHKLLSAYKGKTVVVAFLSSTCPHCQAFVPVLNQIQHDYAYKGVAVVGALFDPNAQAAHPGFVRQYQPQFPLGWATREAVHGWLQYDVDKQTYVPIVAIVDKHGNVVEQHAGEEMFMREPNESVRAKLDSMVGPLPIMMKKTGAGK